MRKLNKKLTIIKYGSNTLVTENINNKVSIDYNNISNHGLIINQIKNPVIIISSGAVAFGKSLSNNFDYIKDEIIRKRIFSALGNPHLSMNWDKYIPDKSVLQSLITHKDLTSDLSKEKILEIICAIFNNDNQNSIIQVNDNDFITDEELLELRNGEFGDNDETTKLLSILCDDFFEEIEVIINTSSDGVLENNKVISTLNINKLTDCYIDDICGLDKTNLGTGGMSNKLRTIRELISKTNNSKVYIINGKKPNQLKNILKGNDVGTKIYK